MKDFFAKRDQRRIVFLALGVVILAAIAAGLLYYRTYQKYERDVAAIQIRGVDLATIADGEYYGECDTGFVKAKVKVVVMDHKMTEIELIEHVNDRGAAAEVLPDRMVEEQRVDVDTVSGATSSSNVIRDAVYNALTGKHTADDIAGSASYAPLDSTDAATGACS